MRVIEMDKTQESSPGGEPFGEVIGLIRLA
jgi:hypothetical protein